jgi:CRP/FNR family transcriptional regulator, nitrogen oxide reductase regulator
MAFRETRLPIARYCAWSAMEAPVNGAAPPERPADDREKGLRGALIFSSLSYEDIRALAAISDYRRFGGGEWVFLEGDAPRHLFVVAEGQVRVIRHSTAGKDFIVAFFNPGEMFGEVAVFEDRPYPASAQAAGPAAVVAVPRADFLAFLSRRPGVALSIINVLVSRLRDAHDRLKDLAIERVEQRLANALFMLSQKLGPTLPFTRQDIADMTGTTTETAIRTLSRFKERGIISTTRGKVTIVSAEKLRLLSEGRPRFG